MEPQKPSGQDPEPSELSAEEVQQQLEQELVAPQEPETPEQPVEEEPQPPTRFERRQERQVERLTDRIAEGMANRQRYERILEKPSQQPYQPLKYEEEEYGVDQLEQDRRLYGDSRYQQGIAAGQTAAQQEFFVDRLERDSDYVATHYSQLDENSDEFNPDLADNLNRMYLATIGFNSQTGVVANPGVRYRDYARAFMVAIDKVATTQSAETAQNLAKQSSRGGVRPTGSTRNSQVGDLSKPGTIAEMDKETYDRNKDAIQQRILSELGV